MTVIKLKHFVPCSLWFQISNYYFFILIFFFRKMQQALVWTYGIYILWGHPVVISYFSWFNLAHNLPTYSRDMTKISRSNVNAVSLICGKKPCMDYKFSSWSYLAHTSQTSGKGCVWSRNQVFTSNIKVWVDPCVKSLFGPVLPPVCRIFPVLRPE